MMSTPGEQDTFARFDKKYEHSQSDVMRGIERTVCGCDYGATSWTTHNETRIIRKLLALSPGTKLLDIGSGSGWPGIYLAKETGCDITLIDLPLSGLRIAMERASTDRLSGNYWAAVADAAAIPFRDGWFDAILHADVLCCLPRKLAVLKSCRRVIQVNGRMVFTVILITPDLQAEEHKIAANSGPPFVESDLTYHEMLRQAGWDITDHRDLTSAYTESLELMLDQLETHADEIAQIFGNDFASQERERRRASLKALKHGLLRRELFGVRPSSTKM